METLHIIKDCADGEIVVRLNGEISDYPTTIIFLDKIYRRCAWSFETYEIYYNQNPHLQRVDASRKAGDSLTTEEYLAKMIKRRPNVNHIDAAMKAYGAVDFIIVKESC